MFEMQAQRVLQMDPGDSMSDVDFERWLGAMQEASSVAAQVDVKQQDAVHVQAVQPPLHPVRAASPKRKRKVVKKKEAAATEAKETRDIELLPTQTDHFARLNRILDGAPFALDLSMLGAGKTYVSAKVALDRGFKHVLVICPVSVIPKWKFVRETHGIPMREIMGFQRLRSTKFHQPSHGLLSRRDYKQQMQVPHAWMRGHFQTMEVAKVEFSAADKLKEWVKEGLLLIIDEVQNIKNISSQFHAAEAIIKEIVGDFCEKVSANQSSILSLFGVKKAEAPELGTSRLLLLSGSPIDKQEHATHIFRALSVMREDRIAQHNIQTREMDWRGMQEIADFCKATNPEAFRQNGTKLGYETFEGYSYRLFQRVFKPQFASSCPVPKTTTVLYKFNAFYELDADGAEIVRRGLGTLRTAARFDGATVNFQGGGGAAAMAGVTRALQIIETGKIKMITRIAKQKLDENKVLKVVIAVNFSDTVADLKAALSEYEPLLLTGSCSEVQRGKTMERFQQANDSHRLLIANQSVISTGVDLDDKHGGFPRLALVSPNYSTITSYQLGHRFQRADTRSDAHVHFVYGKLPGRRKDMSTETLELKVLHALSRKSAVMKETTADQAREGVVFPGDHPDWEEEEGAMGRGAPSGRAGVADLPTVAQARLEAQAARRGELQRIAQLQRDEAMRQMEALRARVLAQRQAARAAAPNSDSQMGI